MQINTPLEHTTVPTNGVRLHVVLAGPPEGQPVVLLHGFPEYWRGWGNQIDPLAQAGLRLIIPDQRGYNLSEVPEDVQSYSMTQLTGDVIGLLDHFGYESANLVGHDWGAAVAWATALAYPQRIRRLGILNVPHPKVMMKFLRGSPRQMLKSWYIGFFQIPGLADWLMGLGNFAGAANLLSSSGGPHIFTPEEIAGYREAWANSGGLTGMINWYRALFRFRGPRLSDPNLHMPVLVLWGRRDIALSYEMAEASMAYCPQGRLKVFETATHWVQHDQAEAISQELIAFLQSEPVPKIQEVDS